MPREVERDEVQRMVAAGAQLVDVLPAEEYDAEHIAGAINIPLKELNPESASRLDPSKPVITYCHDAQ
jgi:rhodanese-related sulfurtransferase